MKQLFFYFSNYEFCEKKRDQACSDMQTKGKVGHFLVKRTSMSSSVSDDLRSVIICCAVFMGETVSSLHSLGGYLFRVMVASAKEHDAAVVHFLHTV